MSTPTTIELERQIIESLPDWIEREPQPRRRLQAALQKTADPSPTFPTFEEFIEWVDEDMSAEWVDGEVVFITFRHRCAAPTGNRVTPSPFVQFVAKHFFLAQVRMTI